MLSDYFMAPVRSATAQALHHVQLAGDGLAASPPGGAHTSSEWNSSAMKCVHMPPSALHERHHGGKELLKTTCLTHCAGMAWMPAAAAASCTGATGAPAGSSLVGGDGRRPACCRACGADALCCHPANMGQH